jgi:hypothetical protein
METLISWSGKRSQSLAIALREWLPYVLQRVEPWMSAKDIYVGTRWAAELGTHLEKINYGIVCVTSENSNAPWVLFEAGTLAKSLDFDRIVPVFLGMKSTDLKGPLSQFQGVETNKEGMKSLILSLNRALPDKDRMTDEQAGKTFETWWPELEKRIKEIPVEAVVSAMEPARSDRQLLEEILEISRRLGGTGEFKEPPTISEMITVLVKQREMLDRKESGIQAAEVAAERGLSDSDPYLLSIREAMSDTWHEQELYDGAIKALKAIENWRPRHNWR